MKKLSLTLLFIFLISSSAYSWTPPTSSVDLMYVKWVDARGRTGFIADTGGTDIVPATVEITFWGSVYNGTVGLDYYKVEYDAQKQIGGNVTVEKTNAELIAWDSQVAGETYTITVTAYDNNGGTVTDTMTIQINVPESVTIP